MAISSQVYEAYKLANPDGSPQEAEAMVNSVTASMGAARPGFQIDDNKLISIFKNQGQPAASPDRAPVEMPRGSATQYDGAPVEQKLGSYTPNAAPVVDPDYQAQGAPVDFPDRKQDVYRSRYTPERFSELEKQIQERQGSRGGWDTMSNIFASLGGGGQLQQNREFLRNRDADELKQLDRFRQQGEWEDKTEDRSIAREQRKAEAASKRDLLDPKSYVSRTAFEAAMMEAEGQPALQQRIKDLPPEMRSAAALVGFSKAAKNATENFYKKQALDENIKSREAISAQNDLTRREIAAANNDTRRFLAAMAREMKEAKAANNPAKIADVQRAIVAEQKFDNDAAKVNQEISAANTTEAALNRALDVLNKKDPISTGGVQAWVANKLPVEMQSPDRVELDSVKNQIIAEVQALQKGPQTEADALRYSKVLNLMTSNPKAGIEMYKEKLVEDKAKKMQEIRDIEDKKKRMRSTVGDDTPVDPYVTDTRPEKPKDNKVPRWNPATGRLE